MSSPIVKVANVAVHDNTFVWENQVWLVPSLISQAKDLVPFDIPLAGIYIGYDVWDKTSSVAGMAFHMQRALMVDTQYPIILDQEGFIMDGWHRVLRAIIDGKGTIKAVRFDKTPPANYTKEKS